jgi:hypothetical protein
MNWLEKCDPRHSLDVTGWDQLYQALPQPEKHLNNPSKVKLLILKVNTISIYLKPWIISTTKRKEVTTLQWWIKPHKIETFGRLPARAHATNDTPTQSQPPQPR